MKIIPVHCKRWNLSENPWNDLLLDDDIFEKIKKEVYLNIIKSKSGITIRVKFKSNPSKSISLANFILGIKGEIDHIDRNPFNNQKSNLRICSHQENNWNKGPYEGRKYKGVVWRNKKGNQWCAQITKTYKSIYLGYFSTPEEAAKAYDKAAKEYFGEFAYQNFSEEVKK